MSLRLLVAEDDRGTARAIETLLRRSGFEVHVAHDGGQALELAHAVNPDVLILDIGMPVLDGIGVARQLRQTPGFEGKSFIALTAYADQGHKDLASEAEFDEYLVKPFRVDTMMSILAEVSSNLGHRS